MYGFVKNSALRKWDLLGLEDYEYYKKTDPALSDEQIRLLILHDETTKTFVADMEDMDNITADDLEKEAENGKTASETPAWLEDRDIVNVKLFFIRRENSCGCCFYSNINKDTGKLHSSNQVSVVYLLIKPDSNGKCGEPSEITANLKLSPRKLFLPYSQKTIYNDPKNPPSFYDLCNEASPQNP